VLKSYNQRKYYCYHKNAKYLFENDNFCNIAIALLNIATAKVVAL